MDAITATTDRAPRFDAVLWDLDGTLIDTYGLILGSMRYATQEVLGEVLPDDYLMSLVGTPLGWQMVQFCGGDEEKGAYLTKVYRAHNEAVHDQLIKGFPGVPELLQALRAQGVPCAVVTSKRHELAARGATCCGIDHLFEFILAPDDFPAHKPDPGPVLEGCRRLGKDPSRCLYVGDSPYDIQAGNGAGCATAAVSWGVFSREKLMAESPTFWVESPAKLQALILG